jgi:arginase/N-omega-hydroxy-L-arginine amidinohydrolase
MLEILVSQGRIGDRTLQTIEGAARTAKALEMRYGQKAITIKSEYQPAVSGWRENLTQARETLTQLSDAVVAIMSRGNVTLMIANTCSASLASLPVVAKAHAEAVVLWVDAHGDFNTPATTVTGYLGGMVLAAACGLWDSGHGGGLQPSRVIVLGARDIDPVEGELLARVGVRLIPPKGAEPAAVLDAINGAPVWVHIDWDALEPGFVPADYKVPGGILPMELQEIMRAIPPSQFLGVEVAEFHPSSNENENRAALSIILDTLAPLIEASAVVPPV